MIDETKISKKKKAMTLLIVAKMLLAVIGSIVEIKMISVYLASTMEQTISIVVGGVISLIPTAFLLCAIRKPNSEKYFNLFLYASIIVPIINEICTPYIMGQAFEPSANFVISFVVSSLPIVFFIFDFHSNHKYAGISHILACIMMVLKILPLPSNIIQVVRAPFGLYSVLFLVANILEWLVIFMFLSLFVKKKVSVRLTPIEDELLRIKQQYESGDISEEEYKEKKAKLLNSI